MGHLVLLDAHLAFDVVSCDVLSDAYVRGVVGVYAMKYLYGILM